jgi:hypothetical protein
VKPARSAAQPQLTLDGQLDPPRLGEWLRLRSTREWAEVEYIAVAGKSTWPYGLPMYVGDIVMRFGPGRWRVSSPGAFFWERWERVALDEAAKQAMEEAAREG